MSVYFIYVHIYIYMHIYIYIHRIYMHMEREEGGFVQCSGKEGKRFRNDSRLLYCVVSATYSERGGACWFRSRLSRWGPRGFVGSLQPLQVNYEDAMFGLYFVFPELRNSFTGIFEGLTHSTGLISLGYGLQRGPEGV